MPIHSSKVILVTGGAGFLGSRLCERLLPDGHEVVCRDNFFAGRRANIARLLDSSRFELARHDVSEPVLPEVDQIYNLACPAAPAHYQYNPVGPRGCDDECKRIAGTVMTDYRRQHGVDIGIARIFDTYGPRPPDSDGRVVSNFIVQALRGEPLTLYGDGSQTRSFRYVDDMVEGGPVRLMNREAGAARELTAHRPPLTARR